jgi:hypothetical protein
MPWRSKSAWFDASVVCQLSVQRLASASLTTAERATLIRLLKKIGYEAAAATEQDEEESAVP